ncbi:metallophosphoesterase [Radiobacillus kanasensis]|uniref:metallophosphoesterase family protein n=1 Tax=Radiobacillus kanasensis TaxID=2844358 RepID=UPI001E5CA8F9|nr:metallophosphoesterase [Radiobacillus kanasensis]UFU00431.1 metallophosphoesterase [Radiobacillus kanasensis]
MKIIVVSDTHIPKRGSMIPDLLDQEEKKADLLIHAGDWQTTEVLRYFQKHIEVVGVAGNVDEPSLIDELGWRKLIHCNGVQIGVIHGHGKGKTTEKRAYEAFKDEAVDIIIFGHSHIPVKNVINGVTMFNPGSATDKRRQKQFSFGKIIIEEEVSIEHIFYESKKGPDIMS